MVPRLEPARSSPKAPVGDDRPQARHGVAQLLGLLGEIDPQPGAAAGQRDGDDRAGEQQGRAAEGEDVVDAAVGDDQRPRQRTEDRAQGGAGP